MFIYFCLTGSGGIPEVINVHFIFRLKTKKKTQILLRLTITRSGTHTGFRRGGQQNVQPQRGTLKSKCVAKSFSRTPVVYLEHLFDEGERTGVNVIPETVNIWAARDSLGDYLMPQQIGSYFSRMALKRHMCVCASMGDLFLHR